MSNILFCLCMPPRQHVATVITYPNAARCLKLRHPIQLSLASACMRGSWHPRPVSAGQAPAAAGGLLAGRRRRWRRRGLQRLVRRRQQRRQRQRGAHRGAVMPHLVFKRHMTLTAEALTVVRPPRCRAVSVETHVPPTAADSRARTLYGARCSSSTANSCPAAVLDSWPVNTGWSGLVISQSHWSEHWSQCQIEAPLASFRSPRTGCASGSGWRSRAARTSRWWGTWRLSRTPSSAGRRARASHAAQPCHRWCLEQAQLVDDLAFTRHIKVMPARSPGLA